MIIIILGMTNNWNSWADDMSRNTNTQLHVAIPLSPSLVLQGVTSQHPGGSMLQADKLIPADWDQIRVARDAALKANPELLQKAQVLSKRMHDFQQKLDAAIIQVDPNMAEIVAKIADHQQSVAVSNHAPTNSSTAITPAR